MAENIDTKLNMVDMIMVEADITEEDLDSIDFYSSDNASDDKTISEKDTILIAMGSIQLVSLVLCITAILFVVVSKLHTKFAYRLASYQVFSSMFVNFALGVATVHLYIQQKTPSDIVCKVGAIALEYFMWVKLLIAMFLLFHIFCLAVLLKNFMKLEMYYVLLSLILPIFISWIPFTTKTYGPIGNNESASWCWIMENDARNGSNKQVLEGIIEQYTLWYGPLAVSIFVSLLMILAILIAFKYRYHRLSPPVSHNEQDSLLEDYMKKYMLKVYFRKLMPLLVYPIIFFALFIVPIVHQVRHHARPSEPSFALCLAHSICYSAVGLFSSIVLIVHVLLVRRLQTWNEYFLDKKSDPVAAATTKRKKPCNSWSYDTVYDDRDSSRSPSRSSSFTASLRL